jgi:hypothetical protein
MTFTSSPEFPPAVASAQAQNVPVTMDTQGRVRASKEQRRLILSAMRAVNMVSLETASISVASDGIQQYYGYMKHVPKILCVFLLTLITVFSGCNKDSGTQSTQSTTPQSQPQTVTPANGGDSQPQTITVHITRTGKKYHRAGCQYLSRSDIPIDLNDAKAKGYTPCSRCNPPQ